MTPDVPPHLDAPHPADAPGLADFGPYVEPDVAAGVKPPHSLDAEREVLSAVFVSGSAMELLVEELTAESFYFERHQVLFRVMAELHENGVAIDSVTVAQALRDRGQYEKIGGARALGELLDRSGFVTNVEDYVAIVRDKARLRHVIEVCRSVENEAHGDVADVSAFVEEVGKRLEGAIDEVTDAPEVIELLSVKDRKDRGEDWLGEPPPEPRILLRNPNGTAFMRSQRVGAIVAPGGTGKTFVITDLAVAIACGGKWLETYQVERRGKVFLGLGEEDEDEARRRVHGTSRRFDMVDREWIEENLFVMGFMGQRVGLMERGPDGNMIGSAWHERLFRTLLQLGPWAAIILDPWSRWGGPDAETDAFTATVGISLLESMLFLPGEPALFVTAHTKKLGFGAKADANNTRGSSAFIDGVRWSVELSKRGPKLLEIESTKTNNTVPGPKLTLARGHAGILRPATPAEVAEQAEAEEAAKEAKKRNRKKASELGGNTL